MASQSPLTDEPLRLPGQTLDEKIEWWTSEGIIGYFLAVAIFFAMAIMEWVGFLSNSPRHPILFSAIAVAAIIALIARVLYVRTEVRKLRLGRDGERAVGQFLEGFRSRGGRIFHDVPGDNFNIDHVLICPQGIYAIETKTWSKPWPTPKIINQNGQLSKAGYTPDRDPLFQATATAEFLSDLLYEMTNRRHPVRPVVAIPGWTINRGLEHGTVCIIEPKDLPDYVAAQRTTLSPEEVKTLAFELSRHIRTAPRRR